MKIFTFFLPQFHSIPENDKWWGEGFSDWVNVKKAKPLFEGHNQPIIPLDKYYYYLSQTEFLKQQAILAKKYGISADEIKLSNEQIAVSGLQIGMIVKIPGTKKIASSESSIGSTKTPVAEVSKPKEKEVASQFQAITHVVEPKETLYSLSKKYGI
jgi:hypothetical protein